MKHPCLRVASVLDIDKSFMDELEKLGRSIIETVKMDAVDFEWCGSYANASARLHSDVDIALPMKDWNTQMELRRLLNDRLDIGNAVRTLVGDFGTKWGIVMMDFNPIVPDNKETAEKYGWAVYSVFERKLYGKPTDLTKQYLSLAPYTQRYTLKPYMSGNTVANSRFDIKVYSDGIRWAKDEWADIVPEWRKILGDKFIEYVVLSDGQLSSN
jgi:hypothetical protein